ncbi:venom allergen 3-like [Frankliniella occidentalis]|uniref:Venom allergen 3-like n=1 Tax=Frankliniella occidentalis TaxID=133901 RepID=A0A6J1T7H3_FRAOC|nr:venom allergen 3-like [Frankliniella occidentalis]
MVRMDVLYFMGVAMTLAFAGAATDYCAICSDHTLCLYQNASSSCQNLTSRNLTSEEQAGVVAAHNEIRNQIASGQVNNGTNGGQPSATNMHRLYWDDEIAAIAQRWATQCKFQHDTCRNSADGTYVGQNILITTDTSSTLSSILEESAQAWFSEVASYNASLASQPYVFDENTGHYTQMAWATTTRVGCGYADYGQSSRSRLVVCNYKEGGNVIGEVMYASGSAASQCTTADSTYTSLCA